MSKHCRSCKHRVIQDGEGWCVMRGERAARLRFVKDCMFYAERKLIPYIKPHPDAHLIGFLMPYDLGEYRMGE